MVRVLTLALAVQAMGLDLASVRGETNLEKRSEKALVYANSALDAAREAYKGGNFEQSGEALKQVQGAVELSYESLVATGKNPRKSSKPFKNAEKATRDLLRRLSGLRDIMSSVDHQLVDPVIENISQVHDRLVTGVMGGGQ